MEEFDSGGVTGIVWRRIDPDHEAAAEKVMERLMRLAREAAGYLGTEIFPPIPGVQDAYVVLYRFDTGENLRGWLETPARRALFRELEPLLLEPAREFFFSHRRRAPGSASSVVSCRIRKGHEQAFRSWRLRILEACRTWPGFLGTESFDAFDGVPPEFVIVVRFDDRARLDAWLRSPVRARFMEEVRPHVEDYRIRRIGTGFEGWFDHSEDTRPPAPWRQALVILAALFPVILLLRSLLHPLFDALPFPVAFLILLTLDVALLTFLIMPHFSRGMGFWLRPRPDRTWRSELAGWAILLGLVGATLATALRIGL